MKNYLRISTVAFVCSISLFSCIPEPVTETNDKKKQVDEQAINGKGAVNNRPTSNDDD